MRTKQCLIHTSLLLAALSLPLTSNAATFDWKASCGCFPDQLTPGMSLYRDTAEVPVLQDGALVISDSVPQQHLFYYLDSTNLLMPTNLVIEAEVRVLSNNDINPPDGKRTASYIQFTTSPGVGNMLFLDMDKIFISHAVYETGPGASVDTTANFHTYRIEVDGIMEYSPLRVYQDGVLVITGSLYYGVPQDHSDPVLYFGDGTFHASGGAAWRSFRHNAAATPSSTFIQSPLSVGTNFTFSFCTVSNQSYTVQQNTNLATTDWTFCTNFLGSGSPCQFLTPASSNRQSFFRVRTP